MLLFIFQVYQDNNNFVVPIGCFSAVVENLGSNSACDPQKLKACFACLLLSHSPSHICEAKYFYAEAVYF